MAPQSGAGASQSGADAGTPDALPPGTVLQQRYKIVATGKQGRNFGAYPAEDTRTDGKITIKVLQCEATEADKALRQFRAEYESLKLLTHPALPKLYDLFEEDGNYFMVLERVDARSLQEIVDAQGGRPLGSAQALVWLSELLDVMEYLHGQDPPIIHRDLQPANIMIGTDNQLKLLDFGIAKIVDKPEFRTIFGNSGNPIYAPVEQFSLKRSDPRMDIFSAGASFYFALSGKAPPPASERVLKAAPLTNLMSVNPSVTEEVNTLIEKMMSIKPAERPPNVVAVRELMAKVPSMANIRPDLVPTETLRMEQGSPTDTGDPKAGAAKTPTVIAPPEPAKPIAPPTPAPKPDAAAPAAPAASVAAPEPPKAEPSKPEPTKPAADPPRPVAEASKPADVKPADAPKADASKPADGAKGKQSDKDKGKSKGDTGKPKGNNSGAKAPSQPAKPEASKSAESAKPVATGTAEPVKPSESRAETTKPGNEAPKFTAVPITFVAGPQAGVEEKSNGKLRAALVGLGLFIIFAVLAFVVWNHVQENQHYPDAVRSMVTSGRLGEAWSASEGATAGAQEARTDLSIFFLCCGLGGASLLATLWLYYSALTADDRGDG